ncbi:MAG TPA: hypothetical protein VLC46_12820 [Thermoanaerobaculia bacterium]|jgi:hypothetical protein|nr:hypothetical protein [Thermoanaerobaculia bacterium]
MSEKKVTVTIASGKISVDPTSVQVKKEQDNVKWVCDTSQFTINLPGFTVDYKQEGGKYVGVSSSFPTLGKIKYDVSSPGAETLDPDVDVIP